DQAAEAFLKFRIRSKHVASFAIEYFACGCQFYLAAAANAYEQLTFEFLLKRTDLLADCRLSNNIAFGSERKALEVDEVTEDLECFYMHCFNVFLIFTRKRIHFY